MAKLSLIDIANTLNTTYEEIELIIGSKTYKEKLYYVPEPVIWKYKPDSPPPEEPTVTMKTVTGSQKRGIKKGDQGWEEWIKEKQAYEEELTTLRMAARYVLALRDIEYPDLSNPPATANTSIDPYPNSEILRKKYWLDYTVLAVPRNITRIQESFMKLSGLESLIDSTKKNLEDSAIPEKDQSEKQEEES